MDMMEERDIIIIGAGPAGLSASIYAARAGLSPLVIERAVAGGMLLSAPRIENYPGFPGGVSGMELGERMARQARDEGAEVKEMEGAVSVGLEGGLKLVGTASGAEYGARALVLATGWSPLRLNVPGEDGLAGRGVSYCVVCDGPLFRGKSVAIAGGGEQAVASALYMTDIASEVFVITPDRGLRAPEALLKRIEEEGVNVLARTRVLELRGEEALESVILRSIETGEVIELPIQGLFVHAGVKPNNELARALGIELDERGFIVVDERQRTSLPGVFAAGDVTNKPIKQVCTAVAQGAVAALEAASYLKKAPVG